MAITILHPLKSKGTTVLPKSFIVYGKLDDPSKEVPEGYVVRKANGREVYYEGMVIPHEQMRAQKPQNPFFNLWAMKFDLPIGISRQERLSLRIFNKLDTTTTRQHVASRDSIAISGGYKSSSDHTNVTQLNAGPASRSESRSRIVSSMLVIDPTPGSKLPLDSSPVAYGYLVGNNTDVDGANTMFINHDETAYHYPSWLFIEPVTAFWAAIFDPFTTTTGFVASNTNKFVVTYSPYGDDETVSNIVLE